MTTGPLGQGFGNSVGMAIAERYLRARFGADVMDHHTFVHRRRRRPQGGLEPRGRLAGRAPRLGRLVTSSTTTTSRSTATPTGRTATTSEALRGLRLARRVPGRGRPTTSTHRGRRSAGMAEEDRPSLLVLRSHIGYPSPEHTDDPRRTATRSRRGRTRTKAVLGSRPTSRSRAPPRWSTRTGSLSPRGGRRAAEWQQRRRWTATAPSGTRAGRRRTGLPGWDAELPDLRAGGSVATRQAIAEGDQRHAGRPCPAASPAPPTSPATPARSLDRRAPVGRAPGGRQIYFGVREHGMGRR